ncbi:hypothetical protein K377_07234 [Streptomyces sp. PsTaAH-137]|nr:hypothetical protein K377_07234 [Streptomyces sp. PsTaAH-137]
MRRDTTVGTGCEHPTPVHGDDGHHGYDTTGPGPGRRGLAEGSRRRAGPARTARSCLRRTPPAPVVPLDGDGRVALQPLHRVAVGMGHSLHPACSRRRILGLRSPAQRVRGSSRDSTAGRHDGRGPSPSQLRTCLRRNPRGTRCPRRRDPARDLRDQRHQPFHELILVPTVVPQLQLSPNSSFQAPDRALSDDKWKTHPPARFVVRGQLQGRQGLRALQRDLPHCLDERADLGPVWRISMSWREGAQRGRVVELAGRARCCPKILPQSRVAPCWTETVTSRTAIGQQPTLSSSPSRAAGLRPCVLPAPPHQVPRSAPARARYRPRSSGASPRGTRPSDGRSGRVVSHRSPAGRPCRSAHPRPPPTSGSRTVRPGTNNRSPRRWYPAPGRPTIRNNVVTPRSWQASWTDDHRSRARIGSRSMSTEASGAGAPSGIRGPVTCAAPCGGE